MPKVSVHDSRSGATIRGVDDWLVFFTDERGEWRFLTTEVDRRWLEAPAPDDRTDKGVLEVGRRMLRDGELGQPIHPDCLADTITHFGSVAI